jgi:hypothetical protein
MTKVTRERAAALWIALANGDLATVEGCEWLQGNGCEPAREHQAKVGAWQLQQDREFYDLLGDERREVPCSADGCARGAIKYSVSVTKRSSPFQD